MPQQFVAFYSKKVEPNQSLIDVDAIHSKNNSLFQQYPMQKAVKVSIIGAALAVVTAITVFALTFSVLPQGYYACLYNSLSSSIDCSTIYEPGRRYVGLFKSFMTVPKTMVTLDFSDMSDAKRIVARTSDGTSLELDVSFQYTIRKENVKYLIANQANAQNALRLWRQTARSTLASVASNYQLSDYFEMRTEIADAMKTALVDRQLSSNENEGIQYYDIEFLQLRRIIIVSEDVERSIVNVQVERQIARQRQYEQQTAAIHAETNLLISEIEAQIRIVDATAKAQEYTLGKQAEAEAVRILNEADMDVYHSITETLGLDADQLVDYLQLDAYSEKKDAFLIASGSGSTIVNLN
ncbi:hypothetical protein P9112_011461 [Eukaryota sp. TZLM1-RC]